MLLNTIYKNWIFSGINCSVLSDVSDCSLEFTSKILGMIGLRHGRLDRSQIVFSKPYLSGGVLDGFKPINKYAPEQRDSGKRHRSLTVFARRSRQIYLARCQYLPSSVAEIVSASSMVAIGKRNHQIIEAVLALGSISRPEQNFRRHQCLLISYALFAGGLST